MTNPPCCHGHHPSPRPIPPNSNSNTRPLTKITSALLSTIALLLMPKCPACLAGYVALLTGLSLSTPAASRLQTALMIVCTSVLAFLVLNGLVKVRRRIANSYLPESHQ